MNLRVFDRLSDVANFDDIVEQASATKVPEIQNLMN